MRELGVELPSHSGGLLVRGVGLCEGDGDVSAGVGDWLLGRGDLSAVSMTALSSYKSLSSLSRGEFYKSSNKSPLISMISTSLSKV